MAEPHAVGGGESAPILSVLLAVPSLDGGAAAAGVVDLVRTLSEAGHRATVVGRSGGRVEDVRLAGGSFVEMDLSSVNPTVVMANVSRLWRLLRRRGCNVVHAHGRSAAWSGLAAARLAGTPFVTTWYKGFREQNGFKRLYNGIMLRGDRVIAASPRIAELIQERYGPRPVSVVPGGVDLDTFDPAGITPERIEAARRAFGIGEATKLAIVPARMLRRKGHHVVIGAVRRLKEMGLRDFACVFASTDAGTRYAGEIWDQVLATETADVIQIAGPLDDMPAAYAASTVVVAAGLQPEGLPRAILEAQALARPVIVSDQSAGPDAVLAPPHVAEDRATGLRCPAGDEAALAAAMVRLFSMPENARRAMGVRGRAFVAARFDRKTASGAALRLYQELVRETAAPTP